VSDADYELQRSDQKEMWPMIEAVVFDLDGVLIDSEPVWEQVRHRLVDERGGHWLPDTQSRLMGMSTAEWARYLSEDLGVGLTPTEVAETVTRRMADSYTRALPLLADATDALGRLGERWPLGLASSSPRSLIDTVLAGAGWTGLFDVTLSTEEVERGKPAPDVYLAVTQRLEVPTHSAVAVEDSTNGLRSAAAAGLRVIAVPRPGYPPSDPALAGADLILSSLTELNVTAVESLQ
jgi:HAD superfamily hydrolase (TIGR01509 family)